jgi:hypothetical protein
MQLTDLQFLSITAALPISTDEFQNYFHAHVTEAAPNAGGPSVIYIRQYKADPEMNLAV